METPPVLASTWVDASTFQLLVRHLLANTRLPWRALAIHLDLPQRIICRLVTGQPRPLRRLDARHGEVLLATSPENLRRLAEVPGDHDELVWHLDQLHRHGVEIGQLAKMIECDVVRTANLLNGRGQASARTELLARAAWSAFQSRYNNAMYPTAA